MATLALSVAGAAAGSALLPAGVSVLGTTISGAVIGSQLGALAGSVVDQALFASSGQPRSVSGPRLTDLKLTSSTEGAPIPRLFGRSRLGGQVIWAAPVEEEATTNRAGGGGKGAPSSRATATTTTTFAYFASFAVALCEGPVTSVTRIWADGQELDLATITWRLHAGAEDQDPDPLIVAHLGAADAPAYRGTAYIVFERLALAPFGNRLPQLSFEVHRALDPLEQQIRGVVLIPGSGEFVYATEPVVRDNGTVAPTAENTHTRQGGTDWSVALDQLDATLPNARSTSLVVSWFGTDLRAALCQLRPAVDAVEKSTSPLLWSVAGLDRSTAPLVSQIDGAAAYGGTPSDQTVVAAIRDLKERGHKVTLTPFILMDIADGNTKPDPYSSAASQPSYPWRGRITLSIAPGHPGSPDKTTAATSEIATFVGTATPAHFTLSGETVVYTGPTEWSLRRMVLHYAKLAAAAGGVDAFVIGSELRGLTQIRSSATAYPFVSALLALAADVKAMLGPATKVTYAADWSEYFGHQPSDGSGDVLFNLDPLWSSPSIDAVAIDCYWPLADWRDGMSHLDRLAGARSVYDIAYLKSNITGGEGYAWYYASPADRDAQVRTPITDGAAGKPWVFRFKDLKSWWLNSHVNRLGGVETPTPTAWVPQSKPVWFTEIGCPAVDRGANQPNVFVDPKSAESSLPWYSRGQRDDLMQRAYLQAFHEAFDPAHPGYVAGLNPTSTVYGAPMVALDHVHVYAWDARPYPAFPNDLTTWADGVNWRLGHWINGRIAGQPLASVVKSLLDGYGFSQADTTALDGLVTGYVLDTTMSARQALQPLELAYFFDTRESEGAIRFRHRVDAAVTATLTPDDLVETKPGADLMTLTRAQETELPATARITYAAIETDYRQAVAQSRRLVGGSTRMSDAELPLALTAAQAATMAETWLHEAWAARERASFTLPPRWLALEPGDVVSLSHAGRTSEMRITEMADHGAREITARSIDLAIYDGHDSQPRPEAGGAAILSGTAIGVFLDLPSLAATEDASAGYVAAAKLPWPGGIAFYRSPETSGYTLAAIAGRPATLGVTLDVLPPGPESRLDKATRLTVRIDQGALTATTPLAMLGGANAAAIQNPAGDWEVVQFESATLIAPATYEISRLLRGQAGTETAMADPIPAGARIVLLDEAVQPIAISRDDIGLPLNWRYGPASRDIGDSTYAVTTHAFSGLGHRPLSPVHIRGRRIGGDCQITWTRRTRIGGDSWTSVEVPLAEETESYLVDILDGLLVKRTLTSSSPSVTYALAEQIADFGVAQAIITVRVAQLSTVYGPGAYRRATI